MRMKEPYEAYLDDYNCLDVYMSKNFFGGKNRIFHMKDTKNRIIPLTIQSQSDLYNGFTHYALSLNGNLEIGKNIQYMMNIVRLVSPNILILSKQSVLRKSLRMKKMI